jgi:hypothetical protein
VCVCVCVCVMCCCGLFFVTAIEKTMPHEDDHVESFYERRRAPLIVFLSICGFAAGFVQAEQIFGDRLGIGDQAAPGNNASEYFETGALSSRLLVGGWGIWIAGSTLHTFLPNPAATNTYVSREQLDTYRQIPPALGIWATYRFLINRLLKDDLKDNFKILENIFIRLTLAGIVGGGGALALNFVLDPPN